MVGGQVVDPHGLPVRGAAVHLLDTARVVVDSTMVDSSGTFYLSAPKAGQFLLRVTGSGLVPIYTRPFRLSVGDFHQERIALNVIEDARVYYEFEVQEHVTPLPNNRAPKYPESLRNEHVQGEVLMQFVVDSAGRAVAGTERVLRSTHAEFTKAVLEAIPTFRFNPARVNGHAVAQVVQMPFQFNIM
jgi:TonB family protein